MILDDAPAAPGGRNARLDELLSRAAVRHPDAPALIDPPNRKDIDGAAPRSLTFAEADRAASAIAARLRDVGLAQDMVVGIQLPNTVESVVALIGVMRAGLIPALLPLLWRRADCAAALNRAGARALIATSRIGTADHGTLALEIAAEVFSIKLVAGFGSPLPNGIAGFNGVFSPGASVSAPAVTRSGNPAAHVAAVTFDVTRDGIVPVARNHMQLLAGALSPFIECGLPQDARILSTMPAHSFAGLALTVLPWLLTGGTLSLHHPFDPDAFAAQAQDRRDLIVLPGPVVARLVDGGLLGAARSVIAAWRAPERVAAAPAWRRTGTALIDVHVFGETGLVAARRGEDGKATPIRSGLQAAPRGAAQGIPVADIARSDAGTLAMRGPMVPRQAFPPGAERGGGPNFRVEDTGFADTGYACRHDPETSELTITAPPVGIVGVGGYRFLQRELQELAAQTGDARTLAALPDALAGHRLAGNASDRETLRGILAARGANPLLMRAFRQRGEALPAAATGAILRKPLTHR